MFLPFFPTEAILWTFGTLQGSIYTVCSLISNKIALTTDVWHFAGQHLYYASQFLADAMFLPFFPTEAILWIYGTLQGSIYTVCTLLSEKIALTTDIWEFAGQHLYYASQFLTDAKFVLFFPTGAPLQWIYGTLQDSSYTVSCLLSNKNRHHNGYMGICRAAPILCKSIPIRWNVSSFLSNRSNVTIDIWDFAWQHLYYLLSNEIAITTDVWDFAGQHVYYSSQFLANALFLPFFPT